VKGEIFDVAVDIRRGSPTFASWESVLLTAENFKQIYIPPGFAHGFCVLSDGADVEYKCTDVYTPADEIALIWNDQQVAIQWPLESPILSPKDATGQSLEALHDKLPTYQI
jgi:dTDP-4-dehydrorhamnose 3,5-epimerase